METSGFIQINTKDNTNLRIVQNYINDNEVKFYSLMPKAKILLKYMIKGLPSE